jgi:thioredoxin reductase
MTTRQAPTRQEDRPVPNLEFAQLASHDRILATAAALEQNGIRALVVDTGQDARRQVLQLLSIIRDDAGYLLTGTDLLAGGRPPAGWPRARHPFPLETSLPGLFAAGDVRYGSMKRCSAAIGEGAMAVALVHRFLAETSG